MEMWSTLLPRNLPCLRNTKSLKPKTNPFLPPIFLRVSFQIKGRKMEKKFKHTSILMVIISLILSVTIYPKTFAQTLTLTIQTDKNTYTLGETVTIFGNLTKNGQPVTDGLIRIEVKTPFGKTLLIRSIQTFPYQTIYCPIYV
jgi:hypothetical protein